MIIFIFSALTLTPVSAPARTVHPGLKPARQGRPGSKIRSTFYKIVVYE